jgi:hypothetical protein
VTNFPATKVTAFVDPIAHAWALLNPRYPLPRELGGPGGVPSPMQLPEPPHWNVDLVDEPVQTPAPSAVRDAELGPGKFLGRRCPQGHRVRYLSGKQQCVLCLRAAVKRSSEKRQKAA